MQQQQPIVAIYHNLLVDELGIDSRIHTPMFVWIVSAMTVTTVVEGCVYIRRCYYGILPRVGGEFELSALTPISLSLCPLMQRP